LSRQSVTALAEHIRPAPIHFTLWKRKYSFA